MLEDAFLERSLATTEVSSDTDLDFSRDFSRDIGREEIAGVVSDGSGLSDAGFSAGLSSKTDDTLVAAAEAVSETLDSVVPESEAEEEDNCEDEFDDSENFSSVPLPRRWCNRFGLLALFLLSLSLAQMVFFVASLDSSKMEGFLALALFIMVVLIALVFEVLALFESSEALVSKED